MMFCELSSEHTCFKFQRVSYLPMFHIIVTSPNKKTDLLFNLLSFHGKSIKHQRLNLEVGSLLEQKVPFVEDLLTDNFGLCCGLATIPENPRKEYLFEHYGDFR